MLEQPVVARRIRTRHVSVVRARTGLNLKCTDSKKSRRPPISGKGNQASAGLKGESGRGLNTFPRVFKRLQSFTGRSPGLERRQVSVVLITVARPRGSFTRFPILPVCRGTQMLSNTKNSPDRRGRYHASDGSVKYCVCYPHLCSFVREAGPRR